MTECFNGAAAKVRAEPRQSTPEAEELKCLLCAVPTIFEKSFAQTHIDVRAGTMIGAKLCAEFVIFLLGINQSYLNFCRNAN